MSERRARDLAFAQFLRLVAHLVRKHREPVLVGYFQQLVELVARKLTVECCSVEDVFFALAGARQSLSVLDDTPLQSAPRVPPESSRSDPRAAPERPQSAPIQLADLLEDEPTPVRRPGARKRPLFEPFER